LNSDEETPGIAMIIELSKELLYSGVPEQVIELYAAYYDLILKNDDNKVSCPLYVPFIDSFADLLTVSEHNNSPRSKTASVSNSCIYNVK